MDLDKIGNLITIRRKELKLTQEKLAEQLEISPKTVSKWERGVNAPDITILIRLADALEVSVQELLSGEIEEVEETTLTESLIYYSKRASLKTTKTIVSIIAFIVILLGTLFIINNYNKFKMYSIRSTSDKYQVEGYVIFNQEKNIVHINNVNIKDSNSGTEYESKITDIKISIYNDYRQTLTIYSENFDSPVELNSYLLNKSYYIDEIVPNDEKNIFSSSTITLKIEYIVEGIFPKEIVIPIVLDKDFSNNRIFY